MALLTNEVGSQGHMKKLSNATWVLGETPSKKMKARLTWTEGKGKAGLPKPKGHKCGGVTGV